MRLDAAEPAQTELLLPKMHLSVALRRMHILAATHNALGGPRMRFVAPHRQTTAHVERSSSPKVSPSPHRSPLEPLCLQRASPRIPLLQEIFGAYERTDHFLRKSKPANPGPTDSNLRSVSPGSGERFEPLSITPGSDGERFKTLLRACHPRRRAPHSEASSLRATQAPVCVPRKRTRN
jgi:hypothetical protein